MTLCDLRDGIVLFFATALLLVFAAAALAAPRLLLDPRPLPRDPRPLLAPRPLQGKDKKKI